ncbi:MAG: hypothetical protein LBU73_01600 [Helicobacteraceae bacterium]|jgi:hypothetical protein|nr:hypothetical protein [Helicobacteraceae bacterium]
MTKAAIAKQKPINSAVYGEFARLKLTTNFVSSQGASLLVNAAVKAVAKN